MKTLLENDLYFMKSVVQEMEKNLLKHLKISFRICFKTNICRSLLFFIFYCIDLVLILYLQDLSFLVYEISRNLKKDLSKDL